jgi:uncharacterized protein (TIRG00374 family)
VISAAALALVFSLADLSAFRGLAGRIRWESLPVVGLLVAAIILMFGCRWYTLLRESIGLRRALLISAVGLAGNQVLPLRGGDALRVAVSARGPEAPSLHAGISALALEKVFDLIAVAGFGIASASALLSTREETAGVNVVAVAVTILAVTSVLLVAARFGWLSRELRRIARWVRMPPRLYRHLYAPLYHVKLSASLGRLSLLLLETVVIWIALYVIGYIVIGRMFGISLGATDAMVLLFAAALGLAIPAAPSGIGTFHAAVVSAFVLLGRTAADGLVLAVGIHGVFFLGFCIAGALAMPWIVVNLRPPADIGGRA